MSDYTDKAWEDIRAYEQKVVKPIFQNATLKQSGFIVSPDRPVKGFNAHFSSRNLFQGTIYQYDGDGLFLHFTSLPILSTILKAGFIRMSDFNCLTDRSEINFASQNFKKSTITEEIEIEKDKMFCLSACESKQEVVLDTHMWEHYADKGHGCSIEFKFTSLHIANMSFGKMQYGKRKMKPLKGIEALMQNFVSSNDGFKVIDPIKFLTPIFAFHKDVKFQNENEVRLFYYQDGSFGNEGPHLNEFRDFYKNDQVCNFIRIYLKGKNTNGSYPGLPNETTLELSPQIEISRIILGPRVDKLYDVISQILNLKNEVNQDFEIWRWDGNQPAYKIG